MALLRCFLIAIVCMTAAPVHGHHMGRSVPIGYAGKGSVQLAAQVIASYFEEQMGRETKLVETGSPAQCLQSVRDREFPMAVVAKDAAAVLPEGIVRLQGVLGPPGRGVVLVIGADAREKLEFSLVQRYLDSLSKGLVPADWERALARVEAGDGVRGVALGMLRDADLI